MRKRILTFALALLLCVGLATPAFAAEDDFVINFHSLTEYHGPGGDVVIPDGVEDIYLGKPFRDNTNITSVTIPDSMTGISTSDFMGCTNLTAIHVAVDNKNYVSQDGVVFSRDMTRLVAYPPGKKGAYVIPESVKEVNFYGCTALTDVTIPNGMTEINEAAFYGCTGLTNVIIPNQVTKIGQAAFRGCTGLTNVSLPNGLTEIGSDAFSCCASLSSVTIPNSVTEIDDCAFDQCFSLKRVTVPKGCKVGEAAFRGTPYKDQKANVSNIAIIVAAVAVMAAVVLLILKKKGVLSKKNVTAAAAKVSEATAKAKKAVKQINGITCSCGTVNPPDAKFCTTCGKPVIVPGRCPACGHQNDPAAKFCQGCGKPLDGGGDTHEA